MQIIEIDNNIRKKIGLIDTGDGGGTTDPGTGDVVSNPKDTVDKLAYLDYKIELFHSDYSSLVYDSFIEKNYVDESSDAEYSLEDYAYIDTTEERQLITTSYSIDPPFTKMKLDVRGEGSIDQLTYLITVDEGQSWYQIPTNEDIELPELASQFRLGIVFPGTTAAKVTSYGFYFGMSSESGSDQTVDNTSLKYLMDYTTRNDYKIELYQSGFAEMVYESFSSLDSAETSANIEQTNSFALTTNNYGVQGEYITQNITLGVEINQAKVVVDKNNLGVVNFNVSNDGGLSWVSPDEQGFCSFNNFNNTLKIKINLESSIDVKPEINSFALFY